MKAIRFLLVLGLLLAACTGLSATQPEVTNVAAMQRPHSALVDVTYDLTDAEGDLCHVSLWYSLDGGASGDHECATGWGDVGPGIMPAAGLVATWDAGVDVPDFASQQFSIRVYADDRSGGVPGGFVYIPSGTFTMGSSEDEPGQYSNETQHSVTLTQGSQPMRIIAFILDPPVIERILTHIGEPSTPPAVLPARSPPQAELGVEPADQPAARTAWPEIDQTGGRDSWD